MIKTASAADIVVAASGAVNQRTRTDNSQHSFELREQTAYLHPESSLYTRIIGVLGLGRIREIFAVEIDLGFHWSHFHTF